MRIQHAQMLPFRLLAPVLASFALLLASCSPADQQDHRPIVLAAASLQEAIEAVAQAWQAQGHGRPVLSFGGTPSLARQVDGGAPADIVITADKEWMDWLAARALVLPESRQIIASNVLVYVQRDEFPPTGKATGQAQNQFLPEPVPLPMPLPLPGGRLAMGDPQSVPAGRYAKAALQAAGLWEGLADAVVPTDNVRTALALVERGEAQGGIVYASDAHASDLVHARPLNLPLPGTMEIAYPAALIAGAAKGTGQRQAEARAFLTFLASDQAGAIFCAHGFAMPPERAPC